MVVQIKRVVLKALLILVPATNAMAQDLTLADAVAAGHTTYERVARGACVSESGNPNIGISGCISICTATDITYLVVASSQYLPTSVTYVRGAIQILSAQNNQAALARATALLADITRVVTWNRHEMYRQAQVFIGLPVFPWPKEYSCKPMVTLTQGLADRVGKLQAYINGTGSLNF